MAHIGCREVLRIGRREVAHMGVSREMFRMAARREAARSRDQQAAAGRRQPPEQHNLAHKMKQESRQFRRIRKRWAAATWSLNYPQLAKSLLPPSTSESQVENFLRGAKLRRSLASQINRLSLG